MKKFINGIYIEVTEEEIEQMKVEQRKYEVQEKHRPLTAEEINQMFLKQNINTLEVDDQTSLRMIDYYPTWESLVGTTVDKAEFKFTYQGNLYKTIPANHTFQSNWVPGVGTESIYTRIDEEHDGDIYDPIPASSNMEYVKGKYYVENNIIYLMCWPGLNDGGKVVLQYTPSQLVGSYFQVVTE